MYYTLNKIIIKTKTKPLYKNFVVNSATLRRILSFEWEIQVHVEWKFFQVLS